MTPEETTEILRRPFQPAVAAEAHQGELLDCDELTLHWLREHCKQCPRCGVHIDKAADTCAMMECLCGYRFCYDCGAPGARCSCTPANHCFWDNVLDRSRFFRGDVGYAEAPVDEETGQIDLRAHITRARERNREARLRRLQEREIKRQEKYLELRRQRFLRKYKEYRGVKTQEVGSRSEGGNQALGTSAPEKLSKNTS